MLTDKESCLPPLPALVWSLTHMFLIPLGGLLCPCPVSKTTSVRKAAESSFGGGHVPLLERPALGRDLALCILPDFWLPALSADTWLHSHFGTSLLGMLEQLEKCWPAESGCSQPG